MDLRHRRPFLLTSLALAVVVLAAAAAVAGTRSDRGDARHVRSAAAPLQVDPEIKAEVGVFRRGRVAEDTVETGNSSGAMARENGIALDEARWLPTGPGIEVWVAPSATGVCLLAMEEGAIAPGGTCFEKEHVLSGDVILTVHGGGSHQVIGLVPDGVRSATVHFADGDDQSVAVRSNSYYESSARSMRDVTFRRPDGTGASVPARG